MAMGMFLQTKSGQSLFTLAIGQGIAVAIATLALWLPAGKAAAEEQAELPLKSGQRVLFLGDSITQNGQYVALTEAFLWAVRPELDLDIIPAGLSSETVSGMTEPVHPFPRPNVHTRLDRAFELTKPDWVFVCYGMNDGIYHPASPEILDAYRDGMQKLIERITDTGARVVLLTPPSFDIDAPPIRKRLAEVTPDEPYGYRNPFVEYDQTLVQLGEIVKSLGSVAGVERVIDVHAATDAYLKRVKASRPDYAYGDGVHPPADGHLAMAIGLLEGLGFPPARVETVLGRLTGLVPADRDGEATEIQQAIHRRMLDRFNRRATAYRAAIGVPAPMTVQAPPLEEAEPVAAAARDALRVLVATRMARGEISQARIDAALARWNDTIVKMEEQDTTETHPDDAVLFLGSSSVRLWKDIATDVAPHHPIQRGYGGARFTDLAVFAERLILPHRYAAAVVFVANDVVGRPTDTPMDELESLVRYVLAVSRSHQPDAPVLLVEITPTSSRWAAWPQIREVNRMLREIALTEPGVHFIETAEYYLGADKGPIDDYFVDDRLHQNRAGYELWGALIGRKLTEVLGRDPAGRLSPVQAETVPAGN